MRTRGVATRRLRQGIVLAVLAAAATVAACITPADTAFGCFDPVEDHVLIQAEAMLDLVSRIGTPAKPLPVSLVRYSPDGKQIFYVRGYDPAVRAEICVRHSDAEDEQVLETFRGPDVDPASWGLAVSPNGDRLAVAAERPTEDGAMLAIYDTATLEKTAEHEIECPGDIGWSPDGRSIWINNGWASLFHLGSGGDAPATARGQMGPGPIRLHMPDSTDSRVIGCSPQGDYFVRTLTRDGSYRIHRTATDDVIGGFRRGQPECLLFDGERIICAVNGPETGSTEIRILRPSAERATLWTGKASGKGKPAWTQRMVWERPGETVLVSIQSFYDVPPEGLDGGAREALMRLDLGTGEAVTLDHIAGTGDWDYNPVTNRIAYPDPDGDGVLERVLD